jgi:hypothetical protein
MKQTIMKRKGFMTALGAVRAPHKSWYTDLAKCSRLNDSLQLQ